MLSVSHFSRPLIFIVAFIAVLADGVANAATETPATQAYLVDATTGAILLDKGSDIPMPPASMSKLMTIYMVFERLQDGRLSLDDKFYVSENAWRKGGAKTGGSTMFLEPGMRVRVEDLIRGIIVQSGNDACIVIAEGISGSEEAFAQEMTARAIELGMMESQFRNSTGWPHPEHVMSPRDIGTLAKITIENFPEYYHYYKETKFVFNGISQSNRNPLLYKDMGADGLKTGHTQEAGYGLTASAMRGSRRMLLVVSGLVSKKMRSSEAERLIEWGFREYDNYDLFSAGDVVTDASVWLGNRPTVPLVIENDLVLTIPKRSRREMVVKVVYEAPLPAPVIKGSNVATLNISAPNMESVEVPLVAGEGAGQLGLVGRLIAAVNYIILGSSE